MLDLEYQNVDRGPGEDPLLVFPCAFVCVFFFKVSPWSLVPVAKNPKKHLGTSQSNGYGGPKCTLGPQVCDRVDYTFYLKLKQLSEAWVISFVMFSTKEKEINQALAPLFF